MTNDQTPQSQSRAGRRQWQEPQAIEVAEALRSSVGGHPLISERLTRKGITTPIAARRFLSAAAYEPASANELPDIDRAVDRLQRAIRDREQILIWGDFDVDGQTSTALLFSALKKKNARVKLPRAESLQRRPRHTFADACPKTWKRH